MATETFKHLRSLLLPTPQECRRARWEPAADIYRTHRGWLVKFDLAGVTSGDISLVARGRRLTLSGVRRDCCLEEGYHYYSLEIAYNRFERVVELPCEVEQAQIDTQYRDGMLLVHLVCEGDER